MFEVELDIDVLKAQKRPLIDQWKEAAEQRGMPYYFGGDRDYIQLRHDRDRANINALVTQAMLLKQAGVTDPVVPFMPESNTLRMMTPDEVIQMGLAVGQFGSQCYATAWALKAQLDAATSVEEVEDVVWPL